MVKIHGKEEYKKTKEKCIDIEFFEKITIKNMVEKIIFNYNYKNKIITTNKLKYININKNIIDLSNSIKKIYNTINYKNEISKKIIKIKTKYYNKIVNNNINYLYIDKCNNITDVSKLGTVNTLIISNCKNITDVSKLWIVNILKLSKNMKQIKGVEKLNNVKWI